MHILKLVCTVNELLQPVSVRPSSERIQRKFLKTKCYCEAVIYRFLGMSQLRHWCWLYVRGGADKSL